MAADDFSRLADDDTRLFWDGVRAHKLLFQKCARCGHVRWPASFVCPACHETGVEWIRACGKGRVYTFAVFHRAFDPAFEDRIPYVVAVVELPEGPLLMTNIVDCDPSEVACDMPVEVAWEDQSPELSLPRFRPARSAEG